MSKAIYAGIFFSSEEYEKLLKKSSVVLDKKISSPHVTMQFGTGKCFPKELLGKEVTIEVIGEGHTDENQGFEVTIPDEIKHLYINPARPHITTSISQNGRPVNTRNVQFKEIERFQITGRIGYFTNEGVLFE